MTLRIVDPNVIITLSHLKGGIVFPFSSKYYHLFLKIGSGMPKSSTLRDIPCSWSNIQPGPISGVQLDKIIE